MDAPDQRERLIEAQNQLLNLFVQHDEAVKANDPRRRNALELQIESALARRDRLRRSE
jgi:hypothetical protein